MTGVLSCPFKLDLHLQSVIVVAAFFFFFFSRLSIPLLLFVLLPFLPSLLCFCFFSPTSHALSSCGFGTSSRCPSGASQIIASRT